MRRWGFEQTGLCTRQLVLGRERRGLASCMLNGKSLNSKRSLIPLRPNDVVTIHTAVAGDSVYLMERDKPVGEEATRDRAFSNLPSLRSRS